MVRGSKIARRPIRKGEGHDAAVTLITPHSLAKNRYCSPAYLDAWMDSKTRNTRKTYMHTLTALHEFLSKKHPDNTPILSNVKCADLVGFVEDRKVAGNAQATLRKHKICLRAVFHFLTSQSIITDNPALSLDVKHIQHDISDRLLSKTERTRIIEASVDPALKIILKLLYRTGITIGECLRMKKTWLGNEPSSNKIETTILGNKEKNRSIFVPASICKEMFEHSKNRPGEYVFATKNGTMISAEQVHRWLAKTLNEANIIKKVTPHSFRHTHAVDSLRKGCNLVDLQKSLGHSDPRTTHVYLNANSEASSATFLDDSD